MTSKSWSYSQLVKEYGEDVALEMLAGMTGYGDFGRMIETQPKPEPPSIGTHCPLCGLPWSSKKSCGPVVL